MNNGGGIDRFAQSSSLFFELLAALECFESLVSVGFAELDPDAVPLFVDPVSQLVGGSLMASAMHCWSRSLISCPRSDQFRSRTFEVSPEEPWQLQPEPLDPDEVGICVPPTVGTGSAVAAPGAELLVVSGGVVDAAAGLVCSGLGCCW